MTDHDGPTRWGVVVLSSCGSEGFVWGVDFTFEGILGPRLLFSTAVFELDRAQWTL